MKLFFAFYADDGGDILRCKHFFIPIAFSTRGTKTTAHMVVGTTWFRRLYNYIAYIYVYTSKNNLLLYVREDDSDIQSRHVLRRNNTRCPRGSPTPTHASRPLATDRKNRPTPTPHRKRLSRKAIICLRCRKKILHPRGSDVTGLFTQVNWNPNYIILRTKYEK